MKSAITVLLFAASLFAATAESEWLRTMNAARALNEAGHHDEAANLYREAVRAAGIFDSDGRSVVLSVSALASAYADAGQMLNAEEGYGRAVALAARTAGKASADYAVVLGSLAAVYAEEGLAAKAERALRESVPILEARVAPSDPRLAVQRICLAQILTTQKNYAEAGALLIEARAALVQGGAGEIAVVNALGMVRMLEGRVDEGAALFEYALRVAEVSEPRSVLRLLSNLAVAYARLGRNRDADSAFRRGLLICEQRETQPSVYGMLLKSYAEFLSETGRRAEARRYRTRSRQVLTAAAGQSGAGIRVDVSAFR